MPPTLQQLTYRFHAALRWIEPPIWRAFSVDARDTLHHLHRTLQALFGWWDYHLYEFEVKGMEFSKPGDDWRQAIDSRSVALCDLGLAVDNTFAYGYDFGDGWEIDLRVDAIEKRVPLLVYPRCHSGARRGPHEDCGGVGGYAEMLAVLADPNDEEHDSMLEWAGGEWDVEEFDRKAANALIAGISRPATRTGRRANRSSEIPEPVRIVSEWLLRSFCNRRRDSSSGRPAVYDVELRKNSFTLLKYVPGEDGGAYAEEVRVARFTYDPGKQDWRLDWPASSYRWRPAWHVGTLPALGPLLLDVESEEQLGADLS